MDVPEPLIKSRQCPTCRRWFFSLWDAQADNMLTEHKRTHRGSS
jgi:hypothetical protein